MAFLSICCHCFSQSRDNFFKTVKKKEQNIIFLHLVLSLNGFHHDNNVYYDLCLVSFFLVEKAETRWWWVSSCVPFCACCSFQLPFLSPTPAGQMPRESINTHTDRWPFFLKRKENILDKNRIVDKLQFTFLYSRNEVCLLIFFRNCLLLFFRKLRRVYDRGSLLLLLLFPVGLSLAILCLDLSLLEKSLTFRLLCFSI